MAADGAGAARARAAAADEEARILEFVNTLAVRTGPVRDTALDLFRTHTLDSMAILELVVWLEQCFAVRVASTDLTPQNFRSVDAIAGYVRRSRAGN